MRWSLLVLILASTSVLAQPVAPTAKPPGEVGKPVVIDPKLTPRDPVNEPTHPAVPVAAPVKETVLPPEKPVTANDVRAAPLPGQESGRLDPLDPGDGTGRLIGRTLLAFPAMPIYLIAQPVRGVLYLKEKYNAVDVVTNIFSTDDRKISLFPTAFVETGFGLNIGARLSMTDVLGQGEKLRARVGFGGQWNKLAVLDLSSGVHRGLEIGLTARYERKENERFFGLGNGDETEDAPPTPIDPNVDDYARRTRYQVDISQIATHATYHFDRWWSATATGALFRKSVDDDTNLISGESTISSTYDTSKIKTFGEPTGYAYTEAEVSYDTRRAGDIYDPPGMRTAGGLATVFVGRETGLKQNDRNFYRIGFDLQHVVRLVGARALQLRAYGETVTGDRADIPFTELPVLGGYYLLRGYDLDRFRDRSAAVVQASYVWPLSMTFAGSLFVDAGRVFDGPENITYKDPRVGYGAALEVYGSKSLIMRMELASSIDGGLFGYITLDPAFETQSRLRRR
ncbi:hypothetical protein BH11MYX2_BH11MYX2_05920 [soil metagenome]